METKKEKIKINISEASDYSGVIMVRLPREVRKMINILVQERKAEQKEWTKANRISMNRICMDAILKEFNIEMVQIQQEENK